MRKKWRTGSRPFRGQERAMPGLLSSLNARTSTGERSSRRADARVESPAHRRGPDAAPPERRIDQPHSSYVGTSSRTLRDAARGDHPTVDLDEDEVVDRIAPSPPPISSAVWRSASRDVVGDVRRREQLARRP
jgi:hypothetical protein